MRWKVAEAKQRFSEVLRAVGDEPQLIFNRDRLVAAVIDPESWQAFLIDPESWQAFQTWRERERQVSLADVFHKFRRIAAEENYEMEVPERQDRGNVFSDVL